MMSMQEFLEASRPRLDTGPPLPPEARVLIDGDHDRTMTACRYCGQIKAPNKGKFWRWRHRDELCHCEATPHAG